MHLIVGVVAQCKSRYDRERVMGRSIAHSSRQLQNRPAFSKLLVAAKNVANGFSSACMERRTPIQQVSIVYWE